MPHVRSLPQNHSSTETPRPCRVPLARRLRHPLGRYRPPQASCHCASLPPRGRPAAPGWPAPPAPAASGMPHPRQVTGNPSAAWAGSEGNPAASPRTQFPGQGDCAGRQWRHHQLDNASGRPASSHRWLVVTPVQWRQAPRRGRLTFRGEGQGPERLLELGTGQNVDTAPAAAGHGGLLPGVSVSSSWARASDGTPAAGLSSTLRLSVFVQD